MDTFSLHVLAADRSFFNDEAISINLNTGDGQYGVLAHHRNTILAVKPGEMSIVDAEGKTIVASVSSGVIRIEDNDVLVLCETAELPEEIDINRAKREAAQAKEAMLQKQSIQSYHTAKTRMARAMSRVKVADKY